MKKLVLFISCFAFIFTLGFTLFACLPSSDPNAGYENDEEIDIETPSSPQQPEEPENPLPTEYGISYSTSNDYIISLSKTSAQRNEIINLRVEVLSTSNEIEFVKANDEYCRAVQDDYYNYSFTMPNENVQIVVSLKEKEPVVLDDILTWTGSPPTKLTATSDVQYQLYQFTFLEPLSITSISKQIKIYSSNAEYLPSSAIVDISLISSADGMKFIGGSFKIDLSQISAGKTKLYLNVTSQDPYSDCTITIDIEIEPYSDLPSLQGNKILFDFSSIDANLIVIDIMNLETGDFNSYETTEDFYSVDIDCQANTTLIIDVYYISQDGEIVGIELPNMETPYAILDSGILVFLEENISISIVC